MAHFLDAWEIFSKILPAIHNVISTQKERNKLLTLENLNAIFFQPDVPYTLVSLKLLVKSPWDYVDMHFDIFQQLFSIKNYIFTNCLEFNLKKYKIIFILLKPLQMTLITSKIISAYFLH